MSSSYSWLRCGEWTTMSHGGWLQIIWLVQCCTQTVLEVLSMQTHVATWQPLRQFTRAEQ